MTTVAQSEMISSYPGNSALRGVIEGEPPTAATPIGLDFGGSAVGVATFNAKEAYIYGKAVDTNLVLSLYGRVRLKDQDGEVTGEWIQIGTDLTVTAGQTDLAKFAAAEFVPTFNEFKLEWSSSGGGATSQAALTLI